MPETKAKDRTVRGETINLRASRKQKVLIDRAAEALGRSRSDFMLDTACREAESVLLDRRYFTLSEEASSASPECSIVHRRTTPNCGDSYRQKRPGTDEWRTRDRATRKTFHRA